MHKELACYLIDSTSVFFKVHCDYLNSEDYRTIFRLSPPMHAELASDLIDSTSVFFKVHYD